MSNQDFQLDYSELNSPKTNVGIVDADSIMFNLGWYFEKADLLPKGDSTYTTVAPEFVHTAVDTFLNKLRKQMKVDILHLHFTGGDKNKRMFEEFYGRPMQKQFRNTLGNSYKSNREEMALPTGYHHTLRALLQQPHAYIHDQWEADEAVILHKKLNPTWVLSSNDKDVYKQHYGTNHFYDKRTKKGVFTVDIDKDFANYFTFLQTIMGDSTDGFIGVKGIGEKGAMKFVSPTNTPAQNWEGVLEAFASKGYPEDDAILNMRFANMHQLSLDDQGVPFLDLWKPEGHHLQPVW